MKYSTMHPSQLTENVICQSNDFVRSAIVAYRIDPGPHTRSGIFDALNRRRNARDYQTPPNVAKAWGILHSDDYLRENLTLAEKVSAVRRIASLPERTLSLRA